MSNEAEQKLLSALGFAMKAGKVRSGELSAEKAVRSGKAKLAVIDRGMSPSSRKRWQDICAGAGVPLIEADDVGRAIGKEVHMVACIADNGFAQMMLRTYKILDPNFGGTLNGKE